MRPRIFVGSSSESLDAAYVIQENLEGDAEITVWKQGIFELSRSTMESLLRVLAKSDYGIFVLSGTDTLRLRQKRFVTARDNVVLEIGMFIAQLGPRRTFFVVPKATENLRIPTDLVGITPGTYDAKRKDRNLAAALGPFCSHVRSQVRRLKCRQKPSRTGPLRSSAGSGPLVIHSALYGSGAEVVDVRDALRSRIRAGVLAACVGNHLGGDPSPHVRKTLTVEYSYRGKRRKLAVAEGGELILPPSARG